MNRIHFYRYPQMNLLSSQQFVAEESSKTLLSSITSSLRGNLTTLATVDLVLCVVQLCHRGSDASFTASKACSTCKWLELTIMTKSGSHSRPTTETSSHKTFRHPVSGSTAAKGPTPGGVRLRRWRLPIEPPPTTIPSLDGFSFGAGVLRSQ